jgi:hypothetical protein
MRLAPSLRYSLYATTAVVFVSGALWLMERYLPGLRTLGNATAAVALRIHGGAAMVLLVLIGCAVSLHAPEGWRERKNLTTGISLGTTLVLLTVTGYFLYYLGGESARAVSSLSHWILGLILPATLIFHVKPGRRPKA